MADYLYFWQKVQKGVRMRALEELKKDFEESIKQIDFSKPYDPYSKQFMKPLFIGQLLMALKERNGR